MRFTDRRSCPRVELRTRVDLALGNRNGECGLESTDLSLSGMGAECTIPPRPGAEVLFGLRLGDRPEPVRGRGHVVWVQPMLECPELRYRLAIRFDALDDASHRAIEHTVGRLLEDAPTMSFPRSMVSSLTRH